MSPCIPYGRLAFRFSSNHEIDLVGYKGSPFRGLFGHVFKTLTCPLSHAECEGCLLNKACLYLKIFESPADQVHSALYHKGPSHHLHPFVLTPPLSREASIPAGIPFFIEITLIGPALQALSHVVLTCQEMGKHGLGRKRTPFRMEEVAIHEAGQWRPLYQPGQILEIPEMVQEEMPPETTFASFTHLTLETMTPLRIKRNQQVAKRLRFATLIRALLRRLDSIARLYGDGPLPIDFSDLIAQAEAVHLIRHDATWRDIPRYSNRQKRHHLLGGLEGRFEFSGDLAPFAPWLLLGERLHVGKATSFGFGRYRLMWSTEDAPF